MNRQVCRVPQRGHRRPAPGPRDGRPAARLQDEGPRGGGRLLLVRGGGQQPLALLRPPRLPQRRRIHLGPPPRGRVSDQHNSSLLVQCISASQSLGFKDHVLESSHGQSAATLVSYCPSRSSELEETATTKHSDRLAEIRCTSGQLLDL